MRNKIYTLCAFLCIIFFFFVACSDDNEPKLPQNPELDEVIKKLEGMTEVSGFVDVLKKVTDINIGKDAITVFAVQDKSNPKSTGAASADTLISVNNIKRHIAKGTHNLSSFTGDSLQLESIGGDLLIITKYEGKIYINGVALVSNTPVSAGKSYIYKVEAVLPTKENAKPSPKYKSYFVVYECNEEWEPDEAEKSPSANAKISFFRLVNSQYVSVDSIFTDNDGKAQYNHSFTDLLYNVTKGDKQSLYDGYLVVGLFTSQAEIDNYPRYPSLGRLSNPKPGSVKVADINGDGMISNEDKFPEYYFEVDVESVAALEVTLVSTTYELPVDYSEKFSIFTNIIKESFVLFLQKSYRIDDMLMKHEVQYPALEGLPDLWSEGYNFIHTFYESSALFSSTDCPANVKADWNAKEMRYKVEMAYIYACLLNYYGGVPIAGTDASALPTRSTEDELYDYINMLTDDIRLKGNQDDSYAATAIAMRLAANKKEYERVRDLAQGIMTSEKYALSSENVFMTQINSETILGGYYKPTDSEHIYIHPIRYAEVLLSYAEACAELGTNTQFVIDRAINPLLKKWGMPNIISGLTQAELRAKIREIYGIEYANQALGFMTIKRWDTFIDALGTYGAAEYNRVIPIPYTVLARYPNIVQNPGY